MWAELNAPARKWFDLVSPCVREDDFIALRDLFLRRGLADHPEYDAMVAQVAKACGQRIELLFLRSLEHHNDEWPLRAALPEESSEWSLRSIDKVCVDHVYAARQATLGVRVIGMAVDKFSARGLEMANACIVLPDNVGFEAVPQVALGVVVGIWWRGPGSKSCLQKWSRGLGGVRVCVKGAGGALGQSDFLSASPPLSPPSHSLSSGPFPSLRHKVGGEGVGGRRRQEINFKFGCLVYTDRSLVYTTVLVYMGVLLFRMFRIPAKSHTFSSLVYRGGSFVFYWGIYTRGPFVYTRVSAAFLYTLSSIRGAGGSGFQRAREPPTGGWLRLHSRELDAAEAQAQGGGPRRAPQLLLEPGCAARLELVQAESPAAGRRC